MHHLDREDVEAWGIAEKIVGGEIVELGQQMVELPVAHGAWFATGFDVPVRYRHFSVSCT